MVEYHKKPGIRTIYAVLHLASTRALSFCFEAADEYVLYESGTFLCAWVSGRWSYSAFFFARSFFGRVAYPKFSVLVPVMSTPKETLPDVGESL